MGLTFKYDAERNKNSIKFGGGLLLNENVFMKAKVLKFLIKNADKRPS